MAFAVTAGLLAGCSLLPGSAPEPAPVLPAPAVGATTRPPRALDGGRVLPVKVSRRSRPDGAGARPS
jgi:hypothetical protein